MCSACTRKLFFCIKAPALRPMNHQSGAHPTITIVWKCTKYFIIFQQKFVKDRLFCTNIRIMLENRYAGAIMALKSLKFAWFRHSSQKSKLSKQLSKCFWNLCAKTFMLIRHLSRSQIIAWGWAKKARKTNVARAR